MRNKLWLVVGTIVFLLMGSPVSAGGPTAGTDIPAPSNEMETWLNADDGSPLTCDDIVSMAEALLPVHAVNELSNMSESECIGPATGSTRWEAYILLGQAAIELNTIEEIDGDDGVVLPLLPGYTTEAGTSAGHHTHDDETPPDHHHASQGEGNPLAHGIAGGITTPFAGGMREKSEIISKLLWNWSIIGFIFIMPVILKILFM